MRVCVCARDPVCVCVCVLALPVCACARDPVCVCVCVCDCFVGICLLIYFYATDLYPCLFKKIINCKARWISESAL